MKNKSGFTLVELLAIIIILGIITALAAPNIIKLFTSNKTTLYCTKITTLETDAIKWGEDNLGLLPTISGSETYNSVDFTIKVQRLIDEGATKPDDRELNLILDPRDDTSLNDVEIKVYLKNNKVYAKIPSAVEICE